MGHDTAPIDTSSPPVTSVIRIIWSSASERKADLEMAKLTSPAPPTSISSRSRARPAKHTISSACPTTIELLSPPLPLSNHPTKPTTRTPRNSRKSPTKAPPPSPFNSASPLHSPPNPRPAPPSHTPTKPRSQNIQTAPPFTTRPPSRTGQTFPPTAPKPLASPPASPPSPFRHLHCLPRITLADLKRLLVLTKVENLSH